MLVPLIMLASPLTLIPTSVAMHLAFLALAFNRRTVSLLSPVALATLDATPLGLPPLGPDLGFAASCVETSNSVSNSA